MPPIELDLAFVAGPLAEAPETPENGPAGPDPALRSEQAWMELLSHWLEALQGRLPAPLRAGGYSLGLHLVDDAGIAELNHAWRQREGPTDVLSFPAQDSGPSDWSGPAGSPLELGDIVISVPTAQRQAGDAGHGLAHELRWLASHGLLHLLGWDHPDDASLEAMLALQDELLSAPP
ncbi:rRNA maturation RNase YbeY [Synechococcus sp. RSCCF101]|uniref:rRNA maturation RNase YbeY n=1 Tax=Synechococcus sp. RSCCF101 TaxID=2511069 RepID=UPI00124821C8|nr:rRNA maturation RNase YbeY [Synechococcus sp. RSCCF101]QEY32835.1 rRNA maturation RNase YbeY [Synechococcus sp. RSCCF101]